MKLAQEMQTGRVIGFIRFITLVWLVQPNSIQSRSASTR
jgi:hypothetical protein